jgi:S-formylglutathione hydrolase FrmB
MLPRMTTMVVLVCCLTIVGCAEPKAGPPAVYQTPTEAAAARIVATRWIDERTRDLTIDSPAVGKQVKVRLLLPAGFESTSRRWPVLYLLHGCCDTYVGWSRSTDIEKLTGKTGLIVAMPEGGAVGFYSDWRVGPKWETFHTVELSELLAGAYREVWRAHNPYDLAGQLKGTSLFVSAGNGRPGPLDKPGAGVDDIEQSIGAENQAFASHLGELGIEAQIDLYGPGTHNWVYWQRELHKAWPMITASLGLS